MAERGVPWGFVLHTTLRKFSSDKCTDLAASLTYFGVLSIFPALLALVSILGLVGQQKQGVHALLQVVPGLRVVSASRERLHLRGGL